MDGDRVSIHFEDSAEEFRSFAGLAESFNATIEGLARRQAQPLSVQSIVDLADRFMPRAQHSALLLPGEGGLRTVMATGAVAARLDRMRERAGEGPGVDALKANDFVVSDDLAADPRWPTLGRLAADELGIRSVACYRLRPPDGQRAVLMFFSDWPAAFDEFAVTMGALVASYCSLVLLAGHLLTGDPTSLPGA